jgi:hypothetical protein
MQTDVPLFTADLIYWYSPVAGENNYKQAIDLAITFDEHCHAFATAKKNADVEGFRRAGLAALSWLKDFGPFSEQELCEYQKRESQLTEAQSLGELKKPVADVAESMLLNVLSCWDVLFCHHYFAGQASAYPLFELMMPRLSPTIEIDEITGKLLRNGKPPKRAIFETSIERLLGFVALLMFRRENRRFPDRPVSVKQMAIFFNETERRLVRWRDETVHLTGKQFDKLWFDCLARTPKEELPAPPLPLLLMAYLWSPLLVRKKGEPVSIMDCAGGYRDWWKRNLVRMQAEGLRFGDEPWPAWLTDQPSGSKSLDSWRSSQSSGLSSQPRDSQ